MRVVRSKAANELPISGKRIEQKATHSLTLGAPIGRALIGAPSGKGGVAFSQFVHSIFGPTRSFHQNRDRTRALASEGVGCFLIAFLLPAMALSQTNLKFQDGAAGQVPPGWFLLDAVKDSGYTAEWRKDGCHGELPCAALVAPASPPPQSFGTLMESFDATPYQGKKVRLRAWIRLEQKTPSDHAQMLLRVGRPHFLEGFLDNMADRPITSSEWRRYDILGEVAPDAETVRIGLMLYGLGRVSIGDVEFGEVTEETSGAAVDAASEAIRKQYARMDSAFVRGDGAEIRELLMPDAQMRVGTIREPLLPAIEGEIAKGSKLTARTEVSSVTLAGDEAIATVRREAADPASGGKRTVVTNHRDTWILTPTGWRWRESLELSYHWVLPVTGADAARPVVNELRTRAVPLDLSGDLSAFGAAVGDARVVALGEAAHGSREFQQLKQGLLEYLVKEKGFTILVAAAAPEVRRMADDLNCEFVGLGEGDIATLANVTHPQSKIVLWTDNTHARDLTLRRKLGRKLYVAGFAFHRGEVRAVGVEGGESRGLNTYTVPPPPAGFGDAVLSEAEMPQFFLSMSALPAGPLAHWLADFHLFHDVGAYWILDDPDASMQPVELSKNYDGIFFVEELHAGGH